MPPRVFVSSVVEDFGNFREAARDGIEAAGCEPILVNEDFPSLAESPRNACLDAVRSSDVYVGILGARAGYIAPSDKTVVEEEYEEAREKGLPTLFFIQEDVEREERQEELVQRISGYVGGVYRRTFRSPAELSMEVERAFRGLGMDEVEDQEEAGAAVDERLRGPALLPGSQVSVTAAFRPLRNEEVIDPRDLESRGREFLRIGHADDIRLFDYGLAYSPAVENDKIKVVVDLAGSREGSGVAAAEMSESGLLYMEAGVARERETGSMTGLGGAVLHEERLEEELTHSFAFAEGIFDHIDPYGRYASLVYSGALRNVGYRRIVQDFRPGTGGMTMGTGVEDPLVVYDAPRRISRVVLANPSDEIERIITLFRRKVNG